MGGTSGRHERHPSPMLRHHSASAWSTRRYLGDTVAKIAYEKASIIKENVPVISSPQTTRGAADHLLDGQVPWFLITDAWGSISRPNAWIAIRTGSPSDCHPLGPKVKLGLLGRLPSQNAAVAARCALELGRRSTSPRTASSKGCPRSDGPDVWTWSRRTSADRPGRHAHPGRGEGGGRGAGHDSRAPRILVVGMLKDKDARGLPWPFCPVIRSGHMHHAQDHHGRFSPQEMLERCAVYGQPALPGGRWRGNRHRRMA